MPDLKPQDYEREDIGVMLSVIFNGGKPWRNALAPDDDMPRGRKNPKKGSSFGACKVDVERAWDACLPYLRDPRALWLRFGRDLEAWEVAESLRLTSVQVEESIYRDVGLIRDAASAGHRTHRARCF